MQTIKKIKDSLSNIASMANPFRLIAIKYIDRLNKKEYVNPPFNVPNERPVEYKFVFEHISELYPKTILDIGTGTTALPHLMANCGCKVTAIDNIDDYWTKGMFNRHYHIINDDITNPKKLIGSVFDMITCVSALEHIEQCDNAVRAMFNLLKSGGVLLLTFPYNEQRGVENVYTLDGSGVKKLPHFKTRVYSRNDIDRWVKENKAVIMKQEYWQFFTGDYWTMGKRLDIPKKTDQFEKHQISCLALKKL